MVTNAVGNLLNSIPLTVNDCYGDPLFPAQLEDTLSKLSVLKNRDGVVTIITKGLADRDVKNSLISCRPHRFAIIYSLTGLNEGGITLQSRFKSILQLKEVTDKLVILIRPIIPGRNDRIDQLAKLIDFAKDIDATLAYGGHYVGNDKILDHNLENRIIDYARMKEINIFPKSACAVSSLFGTICYAHVNENIPNIIGLRAIEKLGYLFDLVDHRISVKKGTSGDANFIRFLTKQQPAILDLDNTSDILSISTKEKIYEATSSYFIWSRNITSCYDCDYCLIPSIAHLATLKTCEIGCDPIDLLRNLK